MLFDAILGVKVGHAHEYLEVLVAERQQRLLRFRRLTRRVRTRLDKQKHQATSELGCVRYGCVTLERGCVNKNHVM